MQTQALTAALAALTLLGGAAYAGKDDAVLLVTGHVADAPVTLDLGTLHAMPPVTVTTSTVVTDGTHEFTGVLMRELLKRLNADGDHVTAIALNEYVVDIPMADFHDYDVIVAYAMDGAPLKRSGKGPLWIIYPRDAHVALQDIRYDYRWVWQLRQLDIR